MELILKQYDIPLLRFSATNDSSTPEIEVHWINEDQRHLLPLDMELSPEGISRWMRRRTIPRNRAYVNRLLAKCGLNANRPMGILALCKGLSVDDSYWVVEEGFEGTFEKYNLFENRFSEVLTGYGSSNRSSLASSPEFTTNGMLPKCWRRISGKVTLYKGGTDGGYNTAAVIGPAEEIVAVARQPWQSRDARACLEPPPAKGSPFIARIHIEGIDRFWRDDWRPLGGGRHVAGIMAS